jgi:3-hydroxybutyryl-CoA dehydrogenase
MSAPQAAASAAAQASIVRVAIVGARGTWLAERAARAGYRVTLEDLMPGRRRLAARQLGDTIAYASSVEEAVREADLVIDFVPDELESKLEIFSLLDRMAPPHTIFATPTETLSIADLASCTYRAERCVALRFSIRLEEFAVEIIHAPGALLPVVDLLTGFWTSVGATVSVSVDQAPLP